MAVEWVSLLLMLADSQSCAVRNLETLRESRYTTPFHHCDLDGKVKSFPTVLTDGRLDDEGLARRSCAEVRTYALCPPRMPAFPVQ
jgi:hypothetical protein